MKEVKSMLWKEPDCSRAPLLVASSHLGLCIGAVNADAQWVGAPS